ncbi:diguanylate cyclase [Thermocladium modestius]|uniref:Diguanylate cyclase n=1 Tax=Thermocladium modestius TaxID=62609 RepID=A0A830GR67_9CREN|nr:NifB/NifX family molybdenum-iron cluster-binding protein [Thermocladium modestius]GGP19278.1 diguanylate cyclase [Thermocladium modestius]
MMQKIAVVASNNVVTGPGEGEYILIYEVSPSGIKEVSMEPNPAINATMHRGLHALRRAKDAGVSSIIVTEIGPPGYRAALSWGLNIYVVPDGTPVNDALTMLIEGKLMPAKGPTHEHGHHGEENHA